MSTLTIPGARLGVVHFMAYPSTMKGEGPVLESLSALCADPTWEVLEVTWIKDPHTRRDAIRMVADAHKKVAYGAQPRLLSQKLDLNSADPAARAPSPRSRRPLTKPPSGTPSAAPSSPAGTPAPRAAPTPASAWWIPSWKSASTPAAWIPT